MSLKRTRCPQCKGKLEPTQRIHPDCVNAWAEAQQAKAEREGLKKVKTLVKLDRMLTRQRKAELKTIPELIKEAQVVFNRWIRARDHDQPCISCGAPPPNLDGLHAGRDAGHYRSTGSASHLRFHEDNCHAQCVRCNQWGAGKAVEYRVGLIQRIGVEKVAALERMNTTHKWTREELILIKEKYRAKLRELKA